jgi:two-component sensor histidine kinase
MNTMSNTPSHILTESILDHLTDTILVTDDQFTIIETYGSLFKSGKLPSNSIDALFKGGAVFLNGKLKFKDKQHFSFLHDFTLTDKSIIHTKVRVVLANVGGDARYIFYIRNNTKAKMYRKDIMKKFLTIEKFSKSRKIRDGRLDEAIYEILELSAKATGIERVNAWVISSDHSEIRCIGNFDLRVNKFVELNNLPRISMPNYFRLFETEKIITTSDTYTDARTKELLDFYLKPQSIQAMMDIPIRIEGDMVGVVCFEHTGSTHEWGLLEQKFGLVIAQMISLAIETHTKLATQKDLEHSVNEQRILLQEVHHRVKNNLAIVSSLINLQSDKAKDDYHRALFEECRNRLNSIATIHQMLYRSKSFSKINFREYLGEIVNNLYDSYGSGEKEIIITRDLEDISLDLSQAVPLSLIVNEVITNSFKHAFNNRKKGAIHIELKAGEAKKRKLTIRDDGPGFTKTETENISLGMDIIDGLVEQIEGKYRFENNKGSVFILEF